MRMKSYARVRKQANVEANGIMPSVAMPERDADHVLLGDVALGEAVRVPPP